METEDEDGTHTKRDIQPGISGAGGAAIRDRQADIAGGSKAAYLYRRERLRVGFMRAAEAS